MKTLLQSSVVGCAVFALTCGSLAQNRTFSSQYSFGDSLSDNGNLYAVTGRAQPPAPYFNGRFSNGPVFTELLGNTILPAATISTVRGNLNFAYGGANAGPGGPVPNLALQIAQYRLQGLPATRNDLFTILAGPNDMIAVLGAATTPANPASLDVAGVNIAQAVLSGVQSLVGLGAKNIVVAGMPNLGSTPRSLASGGVGGAGAAFGLRASNAFNTELTTRLRGIAASAPDVNFVFVDIQGILDRVILDYRTLGYNNATSYYLAPASLGGGSGDPNGYVFWDDIHPTTKTHAILAAVITEELNPEPVLGFAATEGTAALALQGLSAGALDSRLAQLANSNRPTGRSEAYAAFNYGDGNRAADGWRPKFGLKAQVATAGVDLHLTDGFFLGGSANVGRLNATIRGGGGNFKIEDATGRLYGVWRGGPVSFTIDADYGVLDVKGIHRTTAFGGFQTSGKTSGDHWGVGGKLAWAVDTGDLKVHPWLGLRTERVKLDPYSEKDVPSVMMDFDRQNAKSSAGAAGVDVGVERKIGGRLWHFDAHAAWHGEFSSKTRIISGKLANNFTPTTAIAVEDGDGSGVEVGGAATIFFAKNWSATLGYTGDIRSREKLGSRAMLSVQTGY